MTVEFLTKQDLEQMKKEIILVISKQKFKVENIAPALKSKDVKKLLGCSDSKLQYLRDKRKIEFIDSYGIYLYPREQFSALLAA